jgi:adenine-specific DNA-methyltransferase
VNKDKALVPNVDLGGYTWVERDDPRLTEVRLLQEFDRVGEVGGTASDNLLIQGDSYDALHALTRVPEFESEYHGKVKVVYIDPPFNTGQTFEHYEDGLEHSVWLGMMRERLLLIQELLSDDGTVWVHLDAAEVHRCRILMDEIFGPSNYLSTVVWQRTTAKSLAKRTMGTMHEEILVYGASEKAELQSNFTPLDAKYAAKRFSQVDERGPYDTGDLTAGSYRPHLDSGKPWRGFDPSSYDPRSRGWLVRFSIRRWHGQSSSGWPP